MSIRLIALDIDGTIFDSNGCLSDINREAIEEALARGVIVAIASGRAYNSLPQVLKDLKGMRYAITSNGAHIVDMQEEKSIYSSYISRVAVERVIELAESENLYLEAFTGGQAYIDAALYDYIKNVGMMYRNREYVMKTRKPVADLPAFMRNHVNELENINVFFTDPDELERIRPMLMAIPEATITSSLRNNLEVGGKNTSKREAVKVLAEMNGINREEIMCMGDAPNDIPMIEYAGIGVAMGNAWGDTKDHADYIAETNDESGVGKTIRKFAL